MTIDAKEVVEAQDAVQDKEDLQGVHKHSRCPPKLAMRNNEQQAADHHRGASTLDDPVRSDCALLVLIGHRSDYIAVPTSCMRSDKLRVSTPVAASSAPPKAAAPRK